MAPHAKRTGRTTQQRKAAARRAIRQRKADDVLIVLASEKLADFDGFDLPPHVLREILVRFLELAERRPPPGRPKSDAAGGRLVDLLIEGGSSQAAARQRVARILRKTRDAVARAHNRYRRGKVEQN
jgi:hypothetical protein